MVVLSTVFWFHFTGPLETWGKPFRLMCSYQDLTKASQEVGDFVVRAGAGAGRFFRQRRQKWLGKMASSDVFLSARLLSSFQLINANHIFRCELGCPYFARTSSFKLLSIPGIAWVCIALCFEETNRVWVRSSLGLLFMATKTARIWSIQRMD